MGLARVIDTGFWLGVSRLVFSPDESILATAIGDSAQLWEVDTGRTIATLAHQNHITHLAFSPDGSSIATAGHDNTARIWDTLGTQTFVLRGHSGWVVDVDFAPDGELVATASWDGTVKLWRPKNGSLVHTLAGEYRSPIHDIDFSPDGSRLD